MPFQSRFREGGLPSKLLSSSPSPTASTTGTLTCTSLTVSLNGTPGSGVTYLWAGPGVSGPTTTQNTSANAAGNYTLKVTSSVNGCTNTAVTSVTQNTTAPVPSASASNQITCVTNTVGLNGLPASGVTYQWTGPGFNGGTTSQNAVGNISGTFSLTVTSIINGCVGTTSVVAPLNMTPPTATASNSSTLTCTTTTAMLSGTGGGTYNWSGPGIASGATTTSPVIYLPGCYNLTVTNVTNGCTATATTCVGQNTLAPVANSMSSGTITCVSATVSAIVTTSTSPVGYNYLFNRRYAKIY